MCDALSLSLSLSLCVCVCVCVDRKGRRGSIPDGKRQAHEWAKHGSCSGLSRARYFQEEERVAETSSLNTLREMLEDNAGEHVALSDIWNVFAGNPRFVAIKVLIVCCGSTCAGKCTTVVDAKQSDKFCRLEEITSCWRKKQSDNSPGHQIECPNYILSSARNSAVVLSFPLIAVSLFLPSPLVCLFLSSSLPLPSSSSSTSSASLHPNVDPPPITILCI